MIDQSIQKGCFILEYTACGYIDATNHALLAGCTRYPFLDTEGKAQVFALFAERDDNFDCNISNQIVFH